MKKFELDLKWVNENCKFILLLRLQKNIISYNKIKIRKKVQYLINYYV